MVPPRGKLAICAASVVVFPLAGLSLETRPCLTPDGERRARGLALYYKASLLEKSLQLVPAREAFEELLAIDPSNVVAASRAAELAAAANDHARARELLEAAFELDPGGVGAHLNLARFLFDYPEEGAEKASAARALAIAEAAAERFPGEARVVKLLVDLHDEGGRAAAARAAVDTGLAFEGGGAAYWLAMGELAQRAWPEGAPGGGGKADSAYRKALAAAPREFAIGDRVANYYIEADRYEEAGELLADLVAAHPEQLFAREKLVRILSITGEDERALRECRALVRADPNEPRTQRLLAEMYAEADDFEGAVRHRARAMQLGGGEVDDYIELVVQLSDHLDPPRDAEALAWMERGCALFPESVELIYLHAVVLGTNKRHEDSWRRYVESEAAAAKAAPELLDENFYYGFGSAAERVGEHKKAAAHFEKAVELVPEDRPELAAKSLNYHGYMLLELDREIDKAGEMIQRAVEFEPNSPVYLDSLGWYYFKKGQFKKALVELRRADELMGDKADPEVLEHIAQTYEALGEPEKAAKYRERIEGGNE